VGEAAYADAYVAGYAEGLRESLKELLSHASRGHTTTELRILVESQIARIPEDVELKRRSLLNPPRKAAFDSLRRPAPLPWAPATPSPPALEVRAGWSYLFREERPERGVRFVGEILARHDALLWVSSLDPPAGSLPREKVTVLRPAARPSPDGAGAGPGPGEVAGAVRSVGGSSLLVYLDSLELFLTEFGPDTTVRFATWLGNWPQGGSANVVVSVDPGAFAEADLRRVQRAFNSIV
jgi:hypothetical protein